MIPLQYPLLIKHLYLPNPRRNNHLRRLRDRRQRFLKLRQSMRKVNQHLPMIHKLVEVGSQSLETDEHVKDSGLKRLRKISMTRRVESSEDQESLGAPEDASKQGRFLEDDKMHVEAKVDGKEEQSTKPDDSTAGEAVTTASVDDSVVPTTIEEITSKRVQNSTRDTTFKFLKIKEKLVDAELLEEQKLTRKQEKEANIALIESWENTQAMMEADRLLAERLQSKEREELTDEEKANLIYDDREKRETILLHFRA
ncbi:hypothetical protein Tco_0449467 [Tanacetum coccineum]